MGIYPVFFFYFKYLYVYNIVYDFIFVIKTRPLHSAVRFPHNIYFSHRSYFPAFYVSLVIFRRILNSNSYFPVNYVLIIFLYIFSPFFLIHIYILLSYTFLICITPSDTINGNKNKSSCMYTHTHNGLVLYSYI